MNKCCNIKNYKSKKCIRKDGKEFNLPRKFSIKTCKRKKIKGFTMISSCVPFKFCGKNGGSKKKFMFNPNDSKKSFDLYIDKNPKDTIKIKYSTVNDVKNTIYNLEKLYKSNKYSHKRIWQVGMILKTRLKILNNYKYTKYRKAKNITSRFFIANKYFKFLGKRSKIKNQNTRKKLKFNL